MDQFVIWMMKSLIFSCVFGNKTGTPSRGTEIYCFLHGQLFSAQKHWNICTDRAINYWKRQERILSRSGQVRGCSLQFFLVFSHSVPFMSPKLQPYHVHFGLSLLSRSLPCSGFALDKSETRQVDVGLPRQKLLEYYSNAELEVTNTQSDYGWLTHQLICFSLAPMTPAYLF